MGMQAEIRRADISFAYIHLNFDNQQIIAKAQLSILAKALSGQYYCPEFNGQRYLSKRVVAVWASDHTNSLNVALAGCDEADIRVLQNWPGAVAKLTGRSKLPLAIPQEAVMPQWRIVD